MIISFESDGTYFRSAGYRSGHTKEMIDDLSPLEGYGNYRIYDPETIDRVWEALDTGGTVRVEIDGDGEPVGVFTEDGDLEPVEEEPPQPPPEPTQDDYLLDLDFRLSMVELGLI